MKDTNDNDSRLDLVESKIERLSERLAILEREAGLSQERAATVQPHAVQRPVVAPKSQPPIKPQPPLRPKQAKSRRSLGASIEELLGGTLFAWVGGAAVLLAAGLFLALAIDRGWIEEVERVIIGSAASAALLATGLWFYERKNQAQAALAMVGTGIGTAFICLVAATNLYGLIPEAAGLAAGLIIGAVATTAAIRMNSHVIAGLGIVGALLSPVLVGIDPSSTTVAFVLVALAATVGVLVWRNWQWLGTVAFLSSAPQVFYWASQASSTEAMFLVLASFWALFVIAAFGFDVRSPGQRLRPSSAVLLTAATATVALVGYFGIKYEGDETAAELWLAGLAVAHLALGVAAFKSTRIGKPIGILMTGKGIALGDAALGLIASGPVLSAAWSVSAASMAILAARSAADRQLFQIGALAQLVLAGIYVFAHELPPAELATGIKDLPQALIGVLSFAAACITFARSLTKESGDWRALLEGVAIASLAYLTIAGLSGLTLVLVLVAEGIAVTVSGRFLHPRVAQSASLILLAGSLTHVLTVEARPDALVYGLGHVGPAVVALLAVAAGAFSISWIVKAEERWWRPGLQLAGTITVMFLISALIVTPFQPGGSAAGTQLLDLDVRQQGQVLLSVFWGITGLALLTAGLLRDLSRLRLLGFGLLTVSIAKVVLYDLSTLDSLYRVISLLVIGLLLLTAAILYQRVRRKSGDGKSGL